MLLSFVGIDKPVLPAEHDPEVKFAVLPELTVHAWYAEPDEACSEELEIAANVNVNFRLRASLAAEGEALLSRMALEWLERTSENCALLFECEIVLFLRKKGAWFVNSNTDFLWTLSISSSITQGVEQALNNGLRN